MSLKLFRAYVIPAITADNSILLCVVSGILPDKTTFSPSANKMATHAPWPLCVSQLPSVYISTLLIISTNVDEFRQTVVNPLTHVGQR